MSDHWTDHPRWGHLGWGIGLALLMGFGEMTMSPSEDAPEVGFPKTFLLLLGMAFSVALILIGAGVIRGKARLWAFVGAFVLAIVVGASTGTWYAAEGDDLEVPVWQPALLAAAMLLAAIGGIVLRLVGKDTPAANVLLMTGMVGTGTLGIFQPAGWAVTVGLGVVGTYLWLIPELTAFGRYTGLVVSLFAWTAFEDTLPTVVTDFIPMVFVLLFLPLTLILLHGRMEGRHRTVLWWIGAVLCGLLIIMGISTLIAAFLNDGAWWESLIIMAWAGAILAFFLRRGIPGRAAA